MNWEFFAKLTIDESELYLKNFLEVEKKSVIEMIDTAKQDRIIADFTINSIPDIMKWIAKKIKTIPCQPDLNLPLWIRESETYIKDLFDFDEKSGILILRVSYYWGECFIRNFKKLQWSTGDRKYALQNMPVIKGFKKSLEMPPLLILENLMATFITGSNFEKRIDQAIDYWVNLIAKK